MKKEKQKGFAAIFIAIIILVIFFTIVTSILLLSFNQQVVVGENTRSIQSYYAAESGIEDALLRTLKKMTFQNNYQMTINDSEINVNIADSFGGAKTITAQGKTSDNVRKIRVVYAISSEAVSFFYGAQVGEGGIEMQNSSVIEGNVFSNGDIVRLVGNPRITGSVIVAGENNHLTGVRVLQNLTADICNNTIINGILTSRINNGCTGFINHQNLTERINQIPFPISDNQINQWKVEAERERIIPNSVNISSGNHFLGPAKINGDLNITGGNTQITGTLWVTGRIIVSGGSLRLNEEVYGSTSGVIIADGQVQLSGSSSVIGTGRPGSYLMLISKLDSQITGNMAIESRNSPTADIFYAPRGRIHLRNNIHLKKITAWGLRLENSVEVRYDFGLINTLFSSGTGGSWEVIEWLEIK